MKNSRLIFVPLLFALLFAVVGLLASPDRTFGQMTIPTRTPVPNSPTEPPPQPTDDNGGGGGDNGGGDKPSPTNTAQPANTPVPPTAVVPTATGGSPTSTVDAAQSPTPGGTNVPVSPGATNAAATATTAGSLIDKIFPGTTPVTFPIAARSFPTAEPCGEPPTITTLAIANVYDGPGSDYPVNETLGADEVRPIVGRAAYATWWLIQLDGRYKQGWISDKAGIVQGFTGNVPIIEAPAINGALPTPGDNWDPTAVPVCTPTPTPTSDGAVITGAIDNDGNSSSAEKIKVDSDIDTAAEQRTQIAESASPIELEVPATMPTPNLLPIAGLVLIVAAVFVALFLRRSPGGGDTSS